jgi:TolB protein
MLRMPRALLNFSLVRIALAGCFLVSALPAAAQTKAAPTPTAGRPLIVNIDNPSFRRLVTATPQFVVPAGADAELVEMAKAGSQELARLLNFSGLFSVMNEAAYRGIPAGKSTSGANARELEGIDISQWRSIGTESLTVGELVREPGGIALSLRTADVSRNQLLLGKRYTRVVRSQYMQVIRRYADQILRAYTGKPGIFSTRIVFIGRRTKGTAKQVFISDFDGSNAVQITSTNAPHVSPTWSPDGRFVTFTSFEDRNPDLFIYDVVSGRKRKLSGRKGLNSGSNWAPNGKLVAMTGSVDANADIYVIEPTGGERRILIRGEGLDVDPTFSPDGKWIAFVSGRFGNPHIFRASLVWDGETNVRVTGDQRLTWAGWWNATPAWSPESDKIAFAGYDRDIDRFDLFMMNPDGTNLERLTLRAGDNERPTWAPNGQMIMFQSNRVDNGPGKGVNQLWIMNRDGSQQRRINTGLYEAQTPIWGPVLGE